MSSERKSFWKPKLAKLFKKKDVKVNLHNLPEDTVSVNLLHKSEESGLERRFEHLNLNDTPKKSDLDEDPKDLDLENFAERLGLKRFTENKKDFKKFYDFAGRDFAWPSTMSTGEHRAIYYYIVDPVDEIDEEIAKNTIAYRRHLESNDFDSSKGTHVLLVGGKIKRYGQELLPGEYDELAEEFPGMRYVPIVEKKPIVVHKILSTDDAIRKEWQVHICLRNAVNSDDEAKMAGIENGYRMVIDTGSPITIIPYFLREKLYSYREGWKRESTHCYGYAQGEPLYQASRPWNICIGDGTKWSDWYKTQEIYSFQKNTSPAIDCGIIGYDVLNNLPHYKSIRKPYTFIKDVDILEQLEYQLEA